MTEPTRVHSSSIQELSHEEAHETIAEIQNPAEYATDALSVVYGQHPKHGRIYVIIPPLGNSLLLPIELRAFD